MAVVRTDHKAASHRLHVLCQDGSEIFGLDDLRRLHEASEKPKCRVNLKEAQSPARGSGAAPGGSPTL